MAPRADSGRAGRVWMRLGVFLVAGCVSLCALGGCADIEPAEVTPTAAQTAPPAKSPEPPAEHFAPVTSEPPKDTLEALQNADLLIMSYYRARSHLWRNPQDTDVIQIYAQGPQAERDISDAKMRQEAGLLTSGYVQFEPDLDAAYVQSWTDTINGENVEVPYGQVTLPGCHDISQLKGEMPDTGPIPTKGLTRLQVITIIAYDQIKSQWLLIDINMPGGEQVAC